MKKHYVVYSISLNGEVKYVGKTCDFDRRKREHSNYRGNLKYSAIPVDVDLSFVSFSIISEVENEVEALKLEDKYILEYNTIENGWNIRRSGMIKASDEKAYNLAYAKKWNREHVDRHNIINKKYYYAHREEDNARSRKYRQEHYDECITKQREYYNIHKDEINARRRERRARKKAEAIASAS